jgi:HTH-type transcriptional regulator/antitoxin HigA
MITNERQYRITKASMNTYIEALDRLKELPPSRKQPWLRDAQRESILEQIDQLQAQLDQYEKLKSGKIKVPDPVAAVSSTALILIQSRIAKGWDQEELAMRLGMKKQQIQRYEQNNYGQATLTVLSRIAAVLVEATNPVSISDRKPKQSGLVRSTNGSKIKAAKPRALARKKRHAK